MGKPWQWTDKLKWTEDQWRSYAEQPNLRMWIAFVSGSIAGYFELFQHTDYSVEIQYFGLTSAFIGQGYGGILLSQAIESAWVWPNVSRIWVHTCSLDHPAAKKLSGKGDENLPY